MAPPQPLVLAGLALLLGPLPARSQETGSERGPRRFSYGVEASATVGPDDTGFFNYADYGHSALRLARVRGDGALRLGARVSLLASVRADTATDPSLFAAYLRLRPWPARALDVQLGRIPPTFGAFGRRGYKADDPLIGYPLGYQYLTSLRPDAVPARADDLLRMRGRGWRSSFPVGSTTLDNGVPLASAERWDQGVQARVGDGSILLALSVTTGSLCNPGGLHDDNDGLQVAGRVEARPVIGLVLGASVARAAFLSRGVQDVLDPGLAHRDFTQRALGLDAEYSRGYWLVRGELLLSDWRLPPLDASLADRLTADAVSVEGRYKLRPQLAVAVRLDHLGFSEVRDSLFDGRATPWDAPVWRVEAGAGYKLRRNLLLKGIYQQNWRDAGLVHSSKLAAAQVLLWL